MTSLNFDSVHAKIARGREHVKTLKDEIGAYFDSNPYTIIREVNGQYTEWWWKINISRVPDSRRWALVAGDAIHNFRSALDHLIWIVSKEQSTGTFKDALRVFPIYPNEGLFNNALKERDAMLSRDVWAVIESEKPYNRIGLSPSLLFILNRLDIADKHHSLRVVFNGHVTGPHNLSVIGRDITFFVPSIFVTKGNILDCEDGAEIMRLVASSPAPHVDPQIDHRFFVAIAEIIPGKAGNLLQILERVSARVERIVEKVSKVVVIN